VPSRAPATTRLRSFTARALVRCKQSATPDRRLRFFKEARKFNPDYRDAKELSARALYNDGLALINEGDFKGGVHTLWKIEGFYPDGFTDSKQRIQAAIDSAKVKVAVMPFDDLTFKIKYGDVGAKLSSEIIAVGVGRQPVFVDFVTRDYVYTLLAEQDFGGSGRVDVSTASQIGKLIGIQVFVFGKITGVNPYYPKVLQEHGESSATLYRGRQKYGVYASWTKHTRTGEVTVTATYQMIDVNTGRIIDSRSVAKTVSSTGQWVAFRGDKEAIENSVLDHHTTGDVSIHPPEILASDAIKEISWTIASSVLKKYND